MQKYTKRKPLKINFLRPNRYSGLTRIRNATKGGCINTKPCLARIYTTKKHKDNSIETSQA